MPEPFQINFQNNFQVLERFKIERAPVSNLVLISEVWFVYQVRAEPDQFLQAIADP